LRNGTLLYNPSIINNPAGSAHAGIISFRRTIIYVFETHAIYRITYLLSHFFAFSMPLKASRH
jgi:hypothetical protein